MASAFSALVSLQVLTRAINFGLGAVLARTLGPRWYALANVSLQLITSSALFLCKEGLRRACQRAYPGGRGAALAHGVNLAWLAVPLTVISAAVVGLSSTRSPPQHSDKTSSSASDEVPLLSDDEFASTVWMFCLAAVIEACAEPAWLYAQANALIPRRVVAEGGALLLKAVATAWLVLRWREQVGIAFAFAYAQLLYASSYAATLYAVTSAHAGGLGRMLPRQELAEIETDDGDGNDGDDSGGAGDVASAAVWLPRKHRTLCARYCWQSVQKYALTEGERLVLVWLSPLAQQGVFALVANLGSLVARLILQPVEEVVFASFSQRAAASKQRDGQGAAAAAAAGRGDGGGGVLLDMASLVELHALLRGLLLRVLYGAAWSETDAPSLLAVYCAHVCTMSVNGVAEAFVTATASATELDRLSRAMVAFAIVYLMLAAIGLRLAGTVGLVAANCLNMVLRITYSFAFVRRVSSASAAAAGNASGASEPSEPSRLRLLLDSRVLLALGAAAATTNTARLWLGAPQSPPLHHIAHVGIGGICLIGVGIVAIRAEPELLAALRAARRARAKTE